jgi:hypothetical protein
MVLAGLAQLTATVIGRGGGDGPALGAMFGGSSGVVILPLILVGALFLVSGSFAHERLQPPHPPQVRLTH